MKKPRVIILRTAGTNCDWETEAAIRLAGANPERVHINRLIEKEKNLRDYDILVIPGGFTYGDDISAGKILANEIKYKLFEQLQRFAEKRLILGICNGFQVLVKSGLLPGNNGQQEVTLTFNDSGKFEDRWVYLKNTSENCLFTKGLKKLIYLPIAHGEGKFIPKGKKVLKELERNDQVVFKYADCSGKEGDYPINPNGSVKSIAAICNKEGNILGMMPHPERYLCRLHHPAWRRENLLPEEGDGLLIFKNIVEYAR